MKMPPLTPTREGGLCITDAALNPADIIVSTTRAAVSGVIKLVTGLPISHALLYAGSGQVIEAVGEGVVRRSLSASLADATLAVAYRYRRLPTDAAQKIVNFADAQARQHLKYDVGGAIGAGARTNAVVCIVAFGIACPAVAAGVLNDRKKFFCSELVLAAFRRAGYPLTNTAPSVASPDRIVEAYSNGVLEYVGHLKT